LQAAPSFLGDFLEFVSNAAMEYRPARGRGAGEHQYARTDCDTASVECTADSAKRYAFAEVAQIVGKCPKIPDACSLLI
jgi:hypothetical protein